MPADDDIHTASSAPVSKMICGGGAPEWHPALKTQVDPMRSTQEPPLAKGA
jgi:hypothetical protein